MLTKDLLFVGLTRQPTVFGVTYMFAMLNILICLSLYIGANKAIFLVAIFPVHLFFYYVCSKEQLLLEIIKNRSQLCPKRGNSIYHRINGMISNSYDPFS